MILNPYLDLHRELEPERTELKLAMRKKLIWAYSWAIPIEEAIHAIARFDSVVELGAGTGYWAWLAAQAGARVTAYDHEPAQPPRWCEILPGNEATLGQCAHAALLLCWPPYESPMAERALRAFRGNHLIYVGEWRGRTADAAFHDLLEAAWKRREEIAIPRWPGFNDRLFIFERAD